MSTMTSDWQGAVSPKRAAEYMDSTEGTLAKWRHQKVGPPYLKIGGKVLYRTESLENYLRELEEKQMSVI